MRPRIINPSRFQAPNEPVVIEYDCRGRRVTKSFADAHAARRFWIAKDKAEKNPKIKKAEGNE
jgi:hypothetical protein